MSARCVRPGARPTHRERQPGKPRGRGLVTATGVRSTAVVRLGAASLQLAALCLGHGDGRVAVRGACPEGQGDRDIGRWTLDIGKAEPGSVFSSKVQGPTSWFLVPGSCPVPSALCMLHAARCLLLILSTPTWSSGPVRLARSRGERRRGLIPTPGPFGLLLRCRSVHTFGMRSAMSAVVFDREGVVLRAQVLSPRRVLWVRRAEWIAEIGFEALPEPGERAVVTPILATWPAP